MVLKRKKCLRVALLIALAASGASKAMAHTKVPVRIVAEYLMVVPVSIDGRGPYDFVIDTGTNSTLIDPQLAKELGAQAVDRLQVRTLNGNLAVPRYFLKTVSVDSSSVNNLEALAQPLAQLSATNRRIRGVLGMNFLGQFSFLLNYATKHIELFDDKEIPDVSGAAKISIEKSNVALLVPVTSREAQGGCWQLMLDTGVSHPVVFRSHVQSIALNRNAILMQVATNSSATTETAVTVRDMAIAGLHLHDVLVAVAGDQPSPADGLLPASLFHAIWFDRPHSQLILNPR